MERRTDFLSLILVTGATGFLGAHVVENLLKQGHRVRATGRSLPEGQKLSTLGAEFMPADLTDAEAVEKLMTGVESVVHCAALSSIWGKYEDFFEANVVATDHLVKAALRANVKKFVHISTPSLYISPQDRLKIEESEELPPNKINFYAHTKALAEERVDQGFKNGLATIILRPQGIFGVGDRAILPRIIRVAKKGFFPVIRNRNVMIDLTAVENVVHAIDCALRAPKSSFGKKYNITNGEPINNAEVIAQVLGDLNISYREKFIGFKKAWLVAGLLENIHRLLRLKAEPLLTRYSVCALGFSRTLSIEAAKKDLGYQPIIGLQPALQRTLTWLKASGY
jgi:nucleoside-diphosphate-sugar epimerase